MLLSERLVELELLREFNVDVVVEVVPNRVELIEDRSPTSVEVGVLLLVDIEALEDSSDVGEEVVEDDGEVEELPGVELVV